MSSDFLTYYLTLPWTLIPGYQGQGESLGTQEFIIDLVGEIIAFCVDCDVYKDYELSLSAKLWNI